MPERAVIPPRSQRKPLTGIAPSLEGIPKVGNEEEIGGVRLLRPTTRESGCAKGQERAPSGLWLKEGYESLL